MKFTKLYTKPHNQEKAFHTVDEELVKKILYSEKRKGKNRIRISRGDGVIVMWFRVDYEYENFKMGVEHEDNEESWYETSKSVFSFSDDYENYNIYVVQFKSERLLEHEESEEAERYANFYFGIKEDDGRYSKYDVYSESELLQMPERMVLVADKDYFFMIGYRAAMKAYQDEDEYKKSVKMDIAACGLYETWTSYDPYMFANYLEITLPEDENERDYVYQGIETAMDNFLLKCYTMLHENEEEK